MGYSSLYSEIESEVHKGEKLKYCYEIVLRIGGVNQQIPAGLHISLPKVSRTLRIYQFPTSTTFYKMDYTVEDSATTFVARRGDAVFSLVVKTTYLPLWLILVIIALSVIIIQQNRK